MTACLGGRLSAGVQTLRGSVGLFFVPPSGGFKKILRPFPCCPLSRKVCCCATTLHSTPCIQALRRLSSQDLH